MQTMMLNEVIGAVKGSLLNSVKNQKIKGISIDTRTLKTGDLYIPIKGERFDGHDFIDEAVEKGAIAYLTEKKDCIHKSINVVLVENTLKALHDLALFYRKKFSIPFIAVTGSSGKTTTKDMVASVLEQKYKVLKTQGNLNNEIGLPLTLFQLEDYHEMAVIEMGMSDLGEISTLVHMVYPDIAIITNIGSAHIEHLESKEKIFEAKKEILETLTEGQLALLNGDDTYLNTIKNSKFKVSFIGLKNNFLDLKAKGILNQENEVSFYVENTYKNIERFYLKLPGIHNVYNSLMAIYLGKYYNLNHNTIQQGLNKFIPSKMRMDIFENGQIKVINDVYNANPDSMRAALSVLRDIGKQKRKIAILGDMLEMGKWAEEAHIKIGKVLLENNIDILIGVGQCAKYYITGALSQGISKEKALFFKTNKEVIDYITTIIKNGDVFLVKGSRGMKMEEIVTFLQERC